MRIVLIGMRGSGKSTIGKILAKKLNWSYVETDSLIEKNAGQKIATLVEKYGWQYFRKKERDVIKSLKKAEKTVVATGGGVVLEKENMKILKNNSLTIWLKAGIPTLVARCRQDKNRPFLTESKTLKEDLAKTLRQRENLYKSYSDFALFNEKKTPEEVTHKILDKKFCCLIGHPVSHSLSPALHNAAYKKLGLNYLFLALDVTDLKRCIESIRDWGIKGAAVTIPHKIKIMDYLDKIDETAKKIGAINTIINRNGMLSGLNTDWSAALDTLKEKIKLLGKKVALIGAGGAARAIAYGLKTEGARVTIFNRNIDHAKALVEDLGLVGYFPLKEEIRISDFDIVINASSLGMETNESPVSRNVFRPGMVVFDIVYSPRMTTFLKMAKEVGCSIILGERMLLHTLKRQFELFTGYPAPVKVMERILSC